MSKESAATLKNKAERKPVRKVEQLKTANDNFEYTAANDNFEEIDSGRVGEIWERLKIHSGEVSHEGELHNEHSPEHTQEQADSEDDHASEGGGHGNHGGSGTTSGGGDGRGGSWKRAKEWGKHLFEGHGDFWSSPIGTIAVNFLSLGYLIIDFLKNTNWSDAFKTKGGGGGGHKPAAKHDDHGHGGGGHGGH